MLTLTSPEALQEPIVVQSTNVRSCITVSNTNLDNPITIRPPQITSRHMTTIIDRIMLAMNPPPTVAPSTSEGSTTSEVPGICEGSTASEVPGTCEASSIDESSQTNNSPVIAHGTYTKPSSEPVIKPRSEPVIACGTYNPNVSRQSYDPIIAHEGWTPGTAYENEAWVPPVFPYGPNSHAGYGYEHNQPGMYGNHVWSHGPGMNFPPRPVHNIPQPIIRPPPPPHTINAITLSGIDRAVTPNQIRKFVERIAEKVNIRSGNFVFMDETTVAVRYKRDATRLGRSLTGQKLNGGEITATFESRLP